MATIMEKDVLLEVVGSALALMSRKSDGIEGYENHPDRMRLIELRQFLYASFPDEVEYEVVLRECQQIKLKYAD
ncbi:hypothetical protein ACKLNO_08835 [Neisseriaceae bacterium B1]